MTKFYAEIILMGGKQVRKYGTTAEMPEFILMIYS